MSPSSNESHMTPNSPPAPNSNPINIPATRGPVDAPKRRGSLLDSLFSFGKSPVAVTSSGAHSGGPHSPPVAVSAPTASIGSCKSTSGSVGSITADEALNLSRSLNGRKPSIVSSFITPDAAPLVSSSTAAAVLAHYPTSPKAKANSGNDKPVSHLSAQLNNQEQQNYQPQLQNQQPHKDISYPSMASAASSGQTTVDSATPNPDQIPSLRRGSVKGRKQSTAGKSLQGVGLVAAFGGGVGDY